MIEVYVITPRVLNDTYISENDENRRFCFQYIVEMYLGGTTIVFWKKTIYIYNELKRIVCEDQPRRRLTSKIEIF